MEETLSGHSHTLKGYTIATQVFGRGKEFNPVLDPIVRIEAGKLRRAPESYYNKSGSQNPIRIKIPKGANVPIFLERIHEESNNTPEENKVLDVGFEGAWPAVLVRPFQNLTGDPDKNYLGLGLATELASEISRFQEIRVLLYSLEGQARRASDQGARFVIEGSIHGEDTETKVVVNLIDTINHQQIWSSSYHNVLEAPRLAPFPERIADEIAAVTAGEHGVIAKTLSLEARHKSPSQLKTYEAVLRYYEYYLMHTPDSFIRPLHALEHAVKIEPECGQVWGMLGQLYGNIYSLELPGFEPALDKALDYANKGVQLNPENQRCRAILAQVLMFSDELSAARIEANRALGLNTNSLFVLDGIGYLLTLLGDWEQGPHLIKEVMSRNPYYGLYVHYALWTDWIRQENYEQALTETLNFRNPSLFCEPLMQAVTLGQLGRYEEGRRAVDALIKLKPDFPERGRILIKHYIKFNEIFDRMIAGLEKVDLNLL